MSSSVAPTGTVTPPLQLPATANPAPSTEGTAATGTGAGRPQIALDPDAVILLLVDSAVPALTQTPPQRPGGGGVRHSLDFYA